MNMKKHRLPAACAGILVSVTSALAAVRTLPPPPPSGFVDAESSVNVPLPTNEGRHIRLTLDFEPSPTTAVQVAFGNDANADGDLVPEETVVRLGVDCGVPFVWKESKSKVEVEQWNLSTCASGLEQEGDILCSPSPSTFTYSSPSPSTFTLKMTRDQQSNWNLMKVTRRGFFSTERQWGLTPWKENVDK